MRLKNYLVEKSYSLRCLFLSLINLNINSVFILLFILLSFIIHDSNSHTLLSASDQVTGQWFIHLKPMRRHIISTKRGSSSTYSNFCNVLFPESTIRNTIMDVHTDQNQTSSTVIPQQQSSTIPKDFYSSDEESNNTPCLLNVKEDGTFVISPSTTSTNLIFNAARRPKIKAVSPTTEIIEENNDPNKNMMKKMPLQGKWNIKSNPYCTTDRFYDEMVLKSFLRVRRISKIIKTSKIYHDNTVIKKIGTERVRIELRCHIWGRYFGGFSPFQRQHPSKHASIVDEYYDSSDGIIIPTEKNKVRMIRGTIMMIRSGTNINHQKCFWWKNRICLGTFYGEQLPEINNMFEDNGIEF